jgi:hypothetical protein
MAKAENQPTSDCLILPPRLPTPQEAADDLLRRWRLGRSLGLPPALRLDGDGQ